jgi:hypothetical protein
MRVAGRRRGLTVCLRYAVQESRNEKAFPQAARRDDRRTSADGFLQRLKSIRAEHARKSSFIEKLKRAGLT